MSLNLYTGSGKHSSLALHVNATVSRYRAKIVWHFVSAIQEEKVFIFNPTSKEDMSNVTSLVEDKLVLGGFLFDEALVLSKNRKHNKPTSSGQRTSFGLLCCLKWNYEPDVFFI